MPDQNQPVSVSKAELKLLEAIIELAQEEKAGKKDTVLVFDAPQDLGI